MVLEPLWENNKIIIVSKWNRVGAEKKDTNREVRG